MEQQDQASDEEKLKAYLLARQNGFWLHGFDESTQEIIKTFVRRAASELGYGEEQGYRLTDWQ